MSERGSAAVELALGVIVLLIPALLLVVSFGPALERRVLARSLAAETARTLIEADGVLDAVSLDRLVALARSAGVAPNSVRVSVCGEALVPLVNAAGCELAGRAAVDVTIEVTVDPQLLPGGPTTVSHVHTEPTNPYRSRP